jgi:rhamnulokinase
MSAKKKSAVTYCAAIDLGATSGRVMLGRWDGKRLELTEAHRFPNALRSMGGHDYWDVAGLWEQVVAGLRKTVALLPEGASLASVGVDTWGVDHVLVDASGRPVYPTFAYRDNRTQKGLKALAANPKDLARVYANTGIPNVFYNASLQLAETVAKHSSIVELAMHCLFLPDYFNFLLSGRMANEITIASTTQLLGVHTLDWSPAALTHFGIPAAWFAKPVLASTHLGPVSGLDFLPNTEVVVVPGHDTACAYDAMPAAIEGDDLFISSGTWSLVGFESDTPVLGAEALAARISNERCGDGRYRPLTNVIGLWLLEGIMKDFASRPNSYVEWSDLINAAEKLPVPAVLLDVADPAFANPSSMKADIDAQITSRRLPQPQSLAAYTRLICDSLGHGHAAAKAAFERMSGRSFKRILMVGGGSRNRLLCQATANAAGLPVVSFSLEGSAVGNLASQLVSLGAVKNLTTFRALLAPTLSPVIYTPQRS